MRLMTRAPLVGSTIPNDGIDMKREIAFNAVYERIDQANLIRTTRWTAVMRETLTAFISWRAGKIATLPKSLQPALHNSTDPIGPTQASGLVTSQSQTIRHFIAMAQAARRAREPCEPA